MVNQNKTFSFRITRQAKNVFPENVERTEDDFVLEDSEWKLKSYITSWVHN